MRLVQCITLLAAALVACSLARSADPVPADKAGTTSPEEQTLQAVGLACDGPALLEFFRTRTRGEADRDRLTALIKQLGDPATEARDKAVGDLVSLGNIAVPLLRHAVNDLDNLTVADQARRCLQAIEGSGGAAIASAAARLLATHKPAGTAEVLLAYLPFADDPSVAEQVGAALAAVAFPDGKPEPVLVRALEDQLPVRRSGAAVALCRADQRAVLPAVRKLLQDPKPTVRLRVALALAQLKEADAIPVLIDVIGELPPAQRLPAEEYLTHLAGEWAPNAAPQANDEVARRIRRDSWAAWWRATDGAALLQEFRKRTLSDADREQVSGLVQKMIDPAVEVRERALSELVALGPKAVPLLQQTAKGKNADLAKRAQNCLRLIDSGPIQGLPLVAARLIALRKPAGATEALVAYLPFAEDEGVVSEVQTALAVVGFPDGKADPVLVRALADPLPLRRAAAAEALAHAGGLEQGPALRRLLADPDLTVRLRVAVALAGARDKDAFLLLIDLLGELTPEQAGPAQEMLFGLARDKAPNVSLGTDPATRKKCRDAWVAWWKDQGSKIDLAKLDVETRLLGYTLLVEVDDNGGGRVLELGPAGKPRWKIENLAFPVDAHILAGNRVLIAEYNGRKVTERDFQGKVLWEKTGLPGQVVNVQRLPNGNTFIVTDRQLLEVDRTGKEVFSQTPGGITAGYKSANGQITVLINQGTCLRMDAKGKEIKRFSSGRGSAWTSGIDVTLNGRIIIANPDQNKVVEMDSEGKVVWQADAPQITTATRLPNGHTLVASYNNSSAYELDRKGKIVWEHKDGSHVFRARRR